MAQARGYTNPCLEVSRRFRALFVSGLRPTPEGVAGREQASEAGGTSAVLLKIVIDEVT